MLMVSTMLVGVSLTAGCTGGGSVGNAAGPMPSVSADPALAAKVPVAIKADGKITAATEATYPPAEFLGSDGKTVIGFDIDLFKAVAARLGLNAEFQQSTFGEIVPGVSSGKYETGVSAFIVSKERAQQAAMVTYLSAGTQWVTKKGNPSGVSADDPCGKKIAVQKDTVQLQDITARSTACTTAGKPAIDIHPYPGQDAAAKALVSGKVDALVADSPVVAYAVRQNGGRLEALGPVKDSAPYGYVVAKTNNQFADALRAAVQSLIDDGTYQKILASWGVQGGAIKTSQSNPS
jgi:polar amino acid transport system substrate-binding protein